MTSHARDPRRESRPNLANVPDRTLWRALCGRYVPSWAFQPANECACTQCRDAGARLGLYADAHVYNPDPRPTSYCGHDLAREITAPEAIEEAIEARADWMAAHLEETSNCFVSSVYATPQGHAFTICPERH